MNSNKILGYLSILILVVFTVTGIYTKLVKNDIVIINKLFNGIYVVLNLLGFAFLLLTTNVLENHKRKLARVGDILIVTGVAILVLHLPIIAGFALISLGLIIVLLDQILKLKTMKNHLFVEWMKLAWYLFFWVGVVFKLFHLPGSLILIFISVVVLWIAISVYVFKNGMPKYINE